MELIEPCEVYNLLQQSVKQYPCLSDPNYALVVDARTKADYAESHIITAKKAPRYADGGYKVPYDSELECKRYVLVYDGSTSSLDDGGTDAVRLAKLMVDMGSKNKVRIVRGGYEAFSATYPFLRTRDTMYMPMDLDVMKTWPVELIPGQTALYLGDTNQAFDKSVNKDMKIRAHVNCSNDLNVFFDDRARILNVEVDDNGNEDIHKHFKEVCEFIDDYRIERKQSVLVYSRLGISRSVTVGIAYLMHNQGLTLGDAWNVVALAKRNMRPSRGFVEQLSQWECDLRGSRVTDISEPQF